MARQKLKTLSKIDMDILLLTEELFKACIEINRFSGETKYKMAYIGFENKNDLIKILKIIIYCQQVADEFDFNFFEFYDRVFEVDAENSWSYVNSPSNIDDTEISFYYQLVCIPDDICHFTKIIKYYNENISSIPGSKKTIESQKRRQRKIKQLSQDPDS